MKKSNGQGKVHEDTRYRIKPPPPHVLYLALAYNLEVAPVDTTLEGSGRYTGNVELFFKCCLDNMYLWARLTYVSQKSS
jgi:hypothetical protein